MADLKEEIKWENGIYQIETTDPVVGGVDGISNKQAKQLANRTSYLKKQVEDNKSGADLALATKRDVTDSYSKAETEGKLEEIRTALSEKLGKEGTAANSAKLGGRGTDAFVLKSETSEQSGANTVVKRDANGDFGGRYIEAGHFRLKSPAQDNLMRADSKIVFKNEDDNFTRSASLGTLLAHLGGGNVGWIDSDVIGANNKNQIGYARLPGGLILQFGMTHRLAPQEARRQPFAIAFPSACFVCLASLHLPQPDNGITASYTLEWDRTHLTVKNLDADSSAHICWIAIGD